jgi:hypothetical protein
VLRQPAGSAAGTGTREILEGIMSTQLQTSTRRSRQAPLLAAGAGVAAVAVVGLLAFDRLEPGAADAMELELPGGGGDPFAMCIPFTVEDLAEMSPAFIGTVTDVTGDRATLRVDRWYAGGEAPEVVVSVPDGASIALNGTIDFDEGSRYLITAVDGVVNLCGYSGEATPELESAFRAAF